MREERGYKYNARYRPNAIGHRHVCNVLAQNRTMFYPPKQIKQRAEHMHRHLVPVKTSREKHEAMDFFLKHVLELRIFVLKRRKDPITETIPPLNRRGEKEIIHFKDYKQTKVQDLTNNKSTTNMTKLLSLSPGQQGP